ncbi:hypothetical protein JCM24511_02891 [Saitozyma sp. JCM 24511]|nr:hypothetical protein JCM24511_02891 [Saitozyma sp. JCM 24511]
MIDHPHPDQKAREHCVVFPHVPNLIVPRGLKVTLDRSDIISAAPEDDREVVAHILAATAERPSLAAYESAREQDLQRLSALRQAVFDAERKALAEGRYLPAHFQLDKAADHLRVQTFDGTLSLSTFEVLLHYPSVHRSSHVLTSRAFSPRLLRAFGLAPPEMSGPTQLLAWNLCGTMCPPTGSEGIRCPRLEGEDDATPYPEEIRTLYSAHRAEHHVDVLNSGRTKFVLVLGDEWVGEHIHRVLDKVNEERGGRERFVLNAFRIMTPRLEEWEMGIEGPALSKLLESLKDEAHPVETTAELFRGNVSLDKQWREAIDIGARPKVPLDSFLLRHSPTSSRPLDKRLQATSPGGTGSTSAGGSILFLHVPHPSIVNYENPTVPPEQYQRLDLGVQLAANIAFGVGITGHAPGTPAFPFSGHRAEKRLEKDAGGGKMGMALLAGKRDWRRSWAMVRNLLVEQDRTFDEFGRVRRLGKEALPRSLDKWLARASEQEENQDVTPPSNQGVRSGKNDDDDHDHDHDNDNGDVLRTLAEWFETEAARREALTLLAPLAQIAPLAPTPLALAQLPATSSAEGDEIGSRPNASLTRSTRLTGREQLRVRRRPVSSLEARCPLGHPCR